VLLGASISLGAIVASGPALLSGIVVTVVAALAASYATSRALGLPRRVSILIACGNSICGTFRDRGGRARDRRRQRRYCLVDRIHGDSRRRRRASDCRCSFRCWR